MVTSHERAAGGFSRPRAGSRRRFWRWFHRIIDSGDVHADVNYVSLFVRKRKIKKKKKRKFV